MQFTLTKDHLLQLSKINHFSIPEEGMVFIGFRGCLPLYEESHDFQREHQVTLSDINYLNPRCTIGQWLPKDGQFALFPGSTVPHIKYIKQSRDRNGLGANQLMTGFYGDYRKGVHKSGSTTGHDAFRQTGAHPIRRTDDDFDFDNDDRVEFTNPYDNIHAAWSMGTDHDYYASAGCQVIVGYPKCEKRGDEDNVGPWAGFQKRAYEMEDQQRFPYMLLNGRDAQRIATYNGRKKSVRLRFGSKGPLVETLQKALGEGHYYDGNMDGDFGKMTIKAVLEFQSDHFDPSADDGIVGPMTAEALHIDWPKYS